MSKEINADQLIKDYSTKLIGEIFSVRINGKIEKLNSLKSTIEKAIENVNENLQEETKLSFSEKLGIKMFDRAKTALESEFNQKMQKLHDFSQKNNLKMIIEDFEKTDDKFDTFCESILGNVKEGEKKISSGGDNRVVKAMFEYNLYSVDRAIEQLDFHKQFFNDMASEDEYQMDN